MKSPQQGSPQPRPDGARACHQNSRRSSANKPLKAVLRMTCLNLAPVLPAAAPRARFRRMGPSPLIDSAGNRRSLVQRVLDHGDHDRLIVALPTLHPTTFRKREIIAFACSALLRDMTRGNHAQHFWRIFRILDATTIASRAELQTLNYFQRAFVISITSALSCFQRTFEAA